MSNKARNPKPVESVYLREAQYVFAVESIGPLQEITFTLSPLGKPYESPNRSVTVYWVEDEHFWRVDIRSLIGSGLSASLTFTPKGGRFTGILEGIWENTESDVLLRDVGRLWDTLSSPE